MNRSFRCVSAIEAEAGSLARWKEFCCSESALDKLNCDMVDHYGSFDSLRSRSHFFAIPSPLPRAPAHRTNPHHRYSSPLILVEPASPVSMIKANGGSQERLEYLPGPSVTEGSRYENRDSLAHDLSFLANMPELCDVTFLVGEDRQPVCGVRAILAARSR